MAISNERKQEVLTQYNDWVKRSQAVILVEYTGISMKSLDALRAKIRESGGEFHVGALLVMWDLQRPFGHYVTTS